MPSRDSILSETKKALRDVHALLKARGIPVADIDGPSDEPFLRNLQEWQAVRAALESSAQAENQGYQAFPANLKGEGVNPSPADQMDSGKKSPKGL